MSADDNVAVINRIAALINESRLNEAIELFDCGYLYHGPGGQELSGRQGIRRLCELFLSAFYDLTASLDDVICQGDKVAIRGTVSGTHTGEFLGIPASGQSITLPIIDVSWVENGMLRETWGQYDRLHLLEQIGAVSDRQAIHGTEV